MSAAPMPSDPGEPGGGDAEGWALLEGLRRRLDDQAAQTRKTAAQVTQLADSIAALVADQRKRSRWLNLNSFVAYVVFTMLCGGAFYFLYQSRAREMVGARDRAVTERDAAVRRADDATTKTTGREAADAKAWDAWQLLVAGKRDEAAKRVAELQAAPLSRFEREVLVARAKQADTMQVDAAMKTAMTAFKAGRYGEVVTPLEQALVIEGNGARAAEMQYMIGVAQARANELDKAVVHLQAAVGADVAEEDARFQLASGLDRMGQWGKARAEYDRFATAHPQSAFAVFAMRRSATLARMPAVAPVGGAAAVQTPVPAAVRAPAPAVPQPQPQPKQQQQPQPQPQPQPDPEPQPAAP